MMIQMDRIELNELPRRKQRGIIKSIEQRPKGRGIKLFLDLMGCMEMEKIMAGTWLGNWRDFWACPIRSFSYPIWVEMKICGLKIGEILSGSTY